MHGGKGKSFFQFHPRIQLITSTSQIDSEKLARLAGVKKTSANANYHRAKKHLAELLDEQPTIEGGAGSKHGIPNASPTKPRATKRRKTTKQGVSDAENSDAPIKHDESPEPAADVVKEESDD
jgi:hypothetical protein